MGILWEPLSNRHAISSKTTVQNLTKLATRFLLMVRLCESNIINTSVWHPAICPSRYLLLNHWVKFDGTCYMTSLMVRVCESNIICPSSISLSSNGPSAHQAISSQTTGLNLTKLWNYMTSFHGEDLWEWVHYSVSQSVSLSCYQKH